MATLPVVTTARPEASGSTSHRLESAEHQAARPLDVQLQRLVERAAALMGAQRASLVVLDPASQAPVMVVAWSQGLGEPYPANLRVHEEVARWVARHRAPAIIADFAHDPGARALGLMAVGSLLSVPLLAGQQVLGALTMSSPLLSTFRLPHLRLLELVADLGALTIVQARQLEAVEAQKEHLRLLLEVSRALGTTPDARTIIGLTVSAIWRLIRCEEAVLYRYEASSEMLCGVAGLGTQSRQLAEARIRVSDPQSVTAWVAQQRRPLLHSSGTEGFVGRATEALLAQREMALLAVPLVACERLWGVITLARAVPFETGDLRIMLTLSQMIAQALAQTEDASERSHSINGSPAAREEA